ncbi:MAG: NAD-dependent epimerase/dehydratase family protein [Solirubrobacteraceae bacterium]
MSRAVVTGGAGFIGSHVVDALVERGDHVIVIDDLRSGRAENVTRHDGAVELVEADIGNQPELLEGVFHEGDFVYHLAGMADIVPSIERPLAYFQSNVQGTFHVLEAARAAGAARLVYAASSTCYGIPNVYPTPESAPIDTHYPYAQTKYQGELLVLHWHRCYGMATVSLRLFNVYGPRSRTSGTYGAVFGVFLAQKISGKPFTVVGDGTQTRDFTYVTDVARALIRAADSDLAGEVVNIASGDPQPVNRLVELLGGEKVHVPKRPGEPDCTWADTTKARELLGWKPTASFEDGVARMLERIDDWRDAPVWTPESIEKATEAWFAYLGGPQPPA